MFIFIASFSSRLILAGNSKQIHFYTANFTSHFTLYTFLSELQSSNLAGNSNFCVVLKVLRNYWIQTLLALSNLVLYIFNRISFITKETLTSYNNIWNFPCLCSQTSQKVPYNYVCMQSLQCSSSSFFLSFLLGFAWFGYGGLL